MVNIAVARVMVGFVESTGAAHRRGEDFGLEDLADISLWDRFRAMIARRQAGVAGEPSLLTAQVGPAA